MANRYIRSTGGNYNSASTWELTEGGGESVAVPTSSDDVIGVAGSGQLTITAAAVARTVDLSAYTNTITHNAFNWTVSGNVTFGAGMTYTPSGSGSGLIVGGNGTLISAGKLLWTVSTSSGSTLTIGDNLSFVAQKTALISANVSGGAINLNGKTISGNSSVNRVLVRSSALGTNITITVAGGTFANADFRDITLDSSTDLSAITGLSGDCGGNTNITFTTPATQTATGSSANWSAATWSGRVPLPQDDVVLSLTAGQTLTADMPRWGKNISVTTAMNLSANTIAQTIYGSLDLTNVATFTRGTTGSFTFETRTNSTLTSAGETFGSALIAFSMVAGKMTLGDAFSQVGNTATLTAGELDLNDFNSDWLRLTTSSGTTLTMGNGTMTTRLSAGSHISINTGTTVNAEGSTLVIISSASNGTATLGGKTYNDLKIEAGAAGAVSIAGSNTFNDLYTDGGGTKTIRFTSGTTTTLGAGFNGFDNGTNVITINAVTGGSAATLTYSGAGTLALDYLHITDINVTPTSTWYYGDNSTYVSGTGWNAGAPPSGVKNLMLLGVG